MSKNILFRKCIIHFIMFTSIITTLTSCAKKEEDEFFSSFSQEGGTVTAPEVSGSAESDLAADANPDPDSSDSDEEEPDIYVDVCGAVQRPDVYQLHSSARVFEAIDLAGGYRDDAAKSYINRADLLYDGQQLYVPTANELEEMNANRDMIMNQTQHMENDGDANSGSKVNINTADINELTALPGIGESKANAILAYREENGPFSSIDEITKVAGIKDGTYNKIKDDITLE